MNNPNLATNSTTSQLFLTSPHKRHIEERGLLNDMALANCQSVTAEEATNWLGFPVNSSGILFVGTNLQVQFRPDIPYQVKPGEKPAKYLSPKGIAYDAYLPEHPTIENYWGDLEALKKRCFKRDGHPCILITEGVFKAIAGLANDIPTISLLGVWMGLTSKKQDLEGKKHLVDSLRRFAEAGFGFIIVFDADASTNPDVVKAERELSQKLLQYVPNVYTVTGHWNAGVNGETKGMDDFIHKGKIEEFREILERCVLIQREEFEPAITTGVSSTVPAERGCLHRRATAELYFDHSYVAINNKLCRRVGDSFEPCNEAIEKRRIAEWLEIYSDKYERGMYIKCTNPRKVKEILEWVIIRKACVPSTHIEAPNDNYQLRVFARDANLEKRLREGKVDLKDLYDELSNWYTANKLKPIIKKSSCLFDALKRLFREIEKGKFKRGEGRFNGTYFTLPGSSSESQNTKIILTSLQGDADLVETIDIVGVSACKDGDADEGLPKPSLQGSNTMTVTLSACKGNPEQPLSLRVLEPSLQVSLQDSDDGTASVLETTETTCKDDKDDKDDSVFSQYAAGFASCIRTAIQNNKPSLAQSFNEYFNTCVIKNEVTREAVYALLDANEVTEWELLLNPLKTKTLGMGDRVIVSNPKQENYKGAKGRIVDVAAKVDWFGYTVKFDEPVGTDEWGDFTDSELSVDAGD